MTPLALQSVADCIWVNMSYYVLRCRFFLDSGFLRRCGSLFRCFFSGVFYLHRRSVTGWCIITVCGRFCGFDVARRLLSVLTLLPPRLLRALHSLTPQRQQQAQGRLLQKHHLVQPRPQGFLQLLCVSGVTSYVDALLRLLLLCPAPRLFIAKFFVNTAERHCDGDTFTCQLCDQIFTADAHFFCEVKTRIFAIILDTPLG